MVINCFYEGGARLTSLEDDLGPPACHAVKSLSVSIWDSPLNSCRPGQTRQCFSSPVPILVPLPYLGSRLPPLLPAVIFLSALLYN